MNDDHNTPPVNLGVQLAASAATSMARADAAERGETVPRHGGLTTRQKNEIISALDGVLKNQGNEDEQTQIATLLCVLATSRLLALQRRGNERGLRMRLIRAVSEQFAKSLRKLVATDLPSDD